MSVRTYQDALDYLYSFVDYSLQRSYRYSAEVFDLNRVRDLLARLGNPQDRFASLHVAGTKGKGSVSAFIASDRPRRASGVSCAIASSQPARTPPFRCTTRPPRSRSRPPPRAWSWCSEPLSTRRR